jgi:hypothetical protein
MLKEIREVVYLALMASLAFAFSGCGSTPTVIPVSTLVSTHTDFGNFGNPELVTIQGYNGLTEDPYITSDEKYLLFDDAGSINVPISLFYAEKIDYKTFSFVGEIQGIGATEAVSAAAPAIDTAGNLYFLTPRYASQGISIAQGTFTDGVVTNLAPVVGISKQQSGWFNMGAIPSRDGQYLVFTDNGPRTPTSATLPAGVSIVVIAAKNADGTFTRLANSDELMKNVNTARGVLDFGYVAALSNDDLEIFFTAPGFADPNDSIYVARRTSIAEPFGVAEPLNTGPGGPDGLAEGAGISLDGKHFYYHQVVGSGSSSTRTALYVLSR